jgi:hypothetical protein
MYIFIHTMWAQYIILMSDFGLSDQLGLIGDRQHSTLWPLALDIRAGRVLVSTSANACFLLCVQRVAALRTQARLMSAKHTRACVVRARSVRVHIVRQFCRPFRWSCPTTLTQLRSAHACMHSCRNSKDV